MKIKLLDFNALWCQPCQVMKPIIEEIKQELGEKIEVVEIDVDKNFEEANKYGVMGIPTFVVEKEGQEVVRKTGLISKIELLQLINS